MKNISNIVKLFNYPNIIYLLGDIFLYAYIVLTFFNSVVIDSSLLYQVGKIVMTIGGVLGFCANYIKCGKINVFLVGLLIITFGYGHVFGENDFEKNSLLYYSIVHIGLAMNLVNHKHNPVISGIIFYLGIIFLIITLKTGALYAFMVKTSYNYISVIAIFIFGTYIIALEQNNKKIPLLAVFLYSYLTINAFGRGNILSGLVLIVLTVIDRINSLSKKSYKILALVIVVVFACVSMNYLYNKGIFRKFEQRGFVNDASRFSIWTDFAEETMKNPVTILFGGRCANIREDCNMHNSYLQCYANYGLITFVFTILLIINSFLVSWQQKNKTMFIFTFLLMLRASTDKLFFKGYCEFYLYYVFLYVFSKRRLLNKYKTLFPFNSDSQQKRIKINV